MFSALLEQEAAAGGAGIGALILGGAGRVHGGGAEGSAEEPAAQLEGEWLTHLDAQVAVVSKVLPGMVCDTAWDLLLFEEVFNNAGCVVS